MTPIKNGRTIQQNLAAFPFARQSRDQHGRESASKQFNSKLSMKTFFQYVQSIFFLHSFTDYSRNRIDLDNGSIANTRRAII